MVYDSLTKVQGGSLSLAFYQYTSDYDCDSRSTDNDNDPPTAPPFHRT